MKIDISPELAERIQRLVDSDRYASVEAVVEKAICLLEEDEAEYEKELAKVRAMLKEAEEDVKRGDYVEYTDENLHEFFEDVKRRGLERAKRKATETLKAVSEVTND